MRALVRMETKGPGVSTHSRYPSFRQANDTIVHTWTYKYAILLHSVMAIAFGPKPPSYSSILDLDLKIRNFPVPARWRPICEQETPSPPPEIQMIRFMVSFAKESSAYKLPIYCSFNISFNNKS